MAFERPSLQEIIDRIQGDFETRIEGAETLLRRSILGVLARVYAGAVHLLYGFLSFASEQLFASSADSSGLDSIASEYNLSRIAAAKAIGSGVVTGTNGITIPSDSEIQSDAGIVYIVDLDVTISGGVATIDFTSKIAGADGNDNPSIILTFVSPIVGVNNSITVDADGITGGSDAELDDVLRQRILIRKRLPPHGGASHDYETWALEVPGVTKAWAFPLYLGPGTIGLAFVRGNDSSILPNSTQRDVVRDYIIEHTDPASGETIGIPVTAQPGFSIIELFELIVNISINISPNTAAVQSAITSELQDFFDRDAGPGETLFLSRLSEAISLAAGETKHNLIAPISDTVATNNQMHILGTITYGDY